MKKNGFIEKRSSGLIIIIFELFNNKESVSC